MPKKRGSSLVYGWGINDSPVPTSYRNENGVWAAGPHYEKWNKMLQRGHSPLNQTKRPTYVGVTIFEDWKYFTNFKEWMDTQYWEADIPLHLDKDLITLGNREYHPDKCAFVPNYINNLIGTQQKSGEDLPRGVRLDKRCRTKPYEARAGNRGDVKRYVGMFATPEEAHAAWQLAKAEQIEQVVSDEYSKEPWFNQKVADGLLLRSEILRNDYKSGVITTIL